MMEYVRGDFFQGQVVTVRIDGKEIERKVRYNHSDGLYIVYQNRKYFEYECNYDECYGGTNGKEITNI